MPEISHSFPVSMGQRIADVNDPVQVTDLFQVAITVKQDPALEEQIAQLRKIKRMDAEAYRRLKIRLPYLVAATFDPARRHTSTLQAATGLILDLDHLPEAAGEKDRLSSDERIALAMISPGSDGLKLVFRLPVHLSDTKQYSDYYKQFAFKFAQQYRLEQYVDQRTSDAVRACFLSHDPEVYYNPDAVPLEMPEYFSQPEVESLSGSKVQEPSITPDVYRNILQKLGGKPHRPLPGPAWVPPALELLAPKVIRLAAAAGLQTCQAENIQYGNVYFGKRGFSIVPGNKRGKIPALTILLNRLFETAIYSYDEPFLLE